MKKRTKITLRTKIYLTLVGLLALTGVFYAANPISLPLVSPGPTGVAADPTHLFATQYLQPTNISYGRLQRECHGVRDASGAWSLHVEKYMAIAPVAVRGGRVHPARRFHHTRHIRSLRSRHGTFTLFATIRGCALHRTTARLRSTMWAHLATT